MSAGVFASRVSRNSTHPGNFKGPRPCGLKVTGKPLETMRAARRRSRLNVAADLERLKAFLNRSEGL